MAGNIQLNVRLETYTQVIEVMANLTKFRIVRGF